MKSNFRARSSFCPFQPSQHIFANEVFIGDVTSRLLAEIAREGEWAQCFNFIFNFNKLLAEIAREKKEWAQCFNFILNLNSNFNKLLAEIAREKRNERNALTDRQSSRGRIRVAVSAVS